MGTVKRNQAMTRGSTPLSKLGVACTPVIVRKTSYTYASKKTVITYTYVSIFVSFSFGLYLCTEVSLCTKETQSAIRSFFLSIVLLVFLILS